MKTESAGGEENLANLAVKTSRFRVPVAIQAYTKRALFIFNEGVLVP